LGGPTAAPLVDGFSIQATAGADRGVRKVWMLRQAEGQAGATDLEGRGGVLGGDTARFGKLLGCKLGLIVRFRQGHRDLP